MDLKKTIPIENMYDLASTKFDITILRKINKSYGSLVTDYEANLIYSSYEGQIWNLKLNLGTFEVMHGLYRICRLVANKLDVAFEINLEKLPNPNDDGSFLVDLVSDLCIFYRDMHLRQTEFDKEMTVEKTILYSTRNAPFRSSPRFQAKLASIINTMLSKLKAFKNALKTRDPIVIDQLNTDCQKMATDMTICYKIYDTIIRPKLLEAKIGKK